jgi:hypothetical protein
VRLRLSIRSPRLHSALSLGSLALLMTPSMVTATGSDYDVSGVALHQCSCPYPCPCMFENGPDDCALAAVYHFDKGRVGSVSVAGLSMISIDGAVARHGSSGACCRPAQKNAKTNSPAGVVYLDAAATSAQRKALLTLLQAHGEWPGPGRPVEAETIRFAPTTSGYAVTVPGLFQGKTEQVLSRKGTPLTVDGVGFAEGSRRTVGRSVVNDLHDNSLGLHWHLPDTNGSWSQLHWTQTGAESSEKTSFAHSGH